MDCYPVAIGCALVAERRRHIRWWERPIEALARTKAGGWYFLNVAMPVDRVLLPLTNGRVSSAIGQQVGLLETVGAKSGEPRAIPLLYLVDGDRIVLIASKAGAAKHPAWLHNLRANPRVSFLAPRGRSGDYVAREAEGPSASGSGTRRATTTRGTRTTSSGPAGARSPWSCWSARRPGRANARTVWNRARGVGVDPDSPDPHGGAGASARRTDPISIHPSDGNRDSSRA